MSKRLHATVAAQLEANHECSWKARAESAEKALAERTEASMHWELRFHQTLGERDELRAQLSEQIDRGNEAEADVRILRAKLAAEKE